MSMIQTFNSAVSDAINKSDPNYVGLIGRVDFVPESVIVDSDDFNCGALCNELEFCKSVTNYYVRSFDIDTAEADNLDSVLSAFIDLPRRNRAEQDSVYRKRFRSIAVEGSNYRRTTKWALIDAVAVFVADRTTIQVVELFDTNNLYFQIRIEGAVDYDSALFIGSTLQGFLDNEFVGGAGVGEVISYLGEIIDRIKAAGVDYDIMFILQDRTTLTVDCIIGKVQMYKIINARVLNHVTVTKTCNATVV